ncbi:MAG: phosphate transporter, inner rane subunit PstC, partial [Frankiales bacterium]|nr:phosphate transporter, inner rane subunit PstC [Frankiales bacterium]
MSLGALPPVPTDPADVRPGSGDTGRPVGLPRTSAGRDEPRGDRVFRGLSLSAGVGLLLVIVAIAVFLVVRAVPALRENTASFLTSTGWDPNALPPAFGILALAFGTVLSSLLALAMALPVALGVALFISHYAPRRLAGVLGYVVDLLAAVPSVVFGLWGISYLNVPLAGVSRFLADSLGWFPLFDPAEDEVYTRSLLLASVVLAIMILPIIASLSREVFLQVPTTNQEAALALGATRWEMIRMAVFPYAKSGMVSAVMLGLGRALGETMAVAMVLSAGGGISFNLISSSNPASIASNI